MGKNLIQQRRGRGTLRFRAPSHRFVGESTYSKFSDTELNGIIKDIKHCPAHSAPLVEVEFGNGEKIFMIAPQDKKVGDEIKIGGTTAENGNVLALKNIPEGAEIFNIESSPGDGGKFVRAGGNFAKIVAKSEKIVTVLLPSKKQRQFNPECRATIGRAAGSGRLEKPLLRAGAAHFKMKAKNRYWPNVCGQSMNAVAHPHGGKRSSKKNFPLVVPRSAPPGAKVGLIAPRRTGRKR